MKGTILTRHPQGKSGRRIDRERYERVRAAILELLEGGELTHPELMSGVAARLRKGFEGSPHWYGETVKLDLEARRTIERTDTRPQRYRRVGSRPPGRTGKRG